MKDLIIFTTTLLSEDCLSGLRKRKASGIIFCHKHPTQGVQVPNNLVLGFWVIVTLIQVLAKYMIMGYLDL